MPTCCARLLYKMGWCHSLAKSEGYHHHKGTCQLVIPWECQIIHSNQGQIIESTVLKKILDAFEIRKSHTMAYHLQGDNGLVERFNCSLLQTPSYVHWQRIWFLALYAYWTAAHTSTGVSLHMLMFDREPRALLFDSSLGFDPTSYQPSHQACWSPRFSRI